MLPPKVAIIVGIISIITYFSMLDINGVLLIGRLFYDAFLLS